MRVAIALTVVLGGLIVAPTASAAKNLTEQGPICQRGETWNVIKHACQCPAREHLDPRKGKCARW